MSGRNPIRLKEIYKMTLRDISDYLVICKVENNIEKLLKSNSPF